jgi:sulfite oxidase
MQPDIDWICVHLESKVETESPKLYSRAQVAENCSLTSGSHRVWVTRGNGVYDITEFVEVHPGGSRILLAAGGSVDPFWALFSIHNSETTKEILESYRIGDLYPLQQDPDPIPPPSQAIDALKKLFEFDPPRDPSLVTRSERPCNAEASLDVLLEHYITPNSKFYVRNHLPVPEDKADYKLVIEPLKIGVPSIELDINTLKTQYTPVEVIATLQCAGNRRSEMHAVKPTKGLLWEQGGISTAKWKGVLLKDVLVRNGIDPKDLEKDGMKHVWFDAVEGYGASIPLSKVLNDHGDVLLAYEMNGEPIPRDHGYPLRVIVPGTTAARYVLCFLFQNPSNLRFLFFF